jgi:hypothetical protein
MKTFDDYLSIWDRLSIEERKNILGDQRKYADRRFNILPNTAAYRARIFMDTNKFSNAKAKDPWKIKKFNKESYGDSKDN